MAWRAIVLAAGRGPDDAMARAFGVAHKCGIPVAGMPMLQRVLMALDTGTIRTPILLSIDDAAAGEAAAGERIGQCRILASATSAPASAKTAALQARHFPVLVTTADHPLLTTEIVESFLSQSLTTGADFTVGLASADTILAGYPDTKRTFFKLGADRVSGCNLFAVMNDKGLRLFDVWHDLERSRKKPWKLVAAFGVVPLITYALGKMTLAKAFAQVSARLGLVIKPVLLPFAEAAIDVDKPSDHALAERILRSRATTGPAGSRTAT
jgi:GTP:adenosylcobinamide-phosphate guanylyltransferase